MAGDLEHFSWLSNLSERLEVFFWEYLSAFEETFTSCRFFSAFANYLDDSQEIFFKYSYLIEERWDLMAVI